MSWSFHPLSYGIDCRSGSSKRLSLFRHPPRIICHSIGQLFPFVGNCKHCEYSVLVCQANRRRFYWFSSWKNKQFQWHFVAHASLIHWCLNTITLKHYHTLKASTFQTRVLLFWSIEREKEYFGLFGCWIYPSISTISQSKQWFCWARQSKPKSEWKKRASTSINVLWMSE